MAKVNAVLQVSLRGAHTTFPLNPRAPRPLSSPSVMLAAVCPTALYYYASGTRCLKGRLLYHHYVPSSDTLFKSICRLEPGGFLPTQLALSARVHALSVRGGAQGTLIFDFISVGACNKKVEETMENTDRQGEVGQRAKVALMPLFTPTGK